MSINNVINLFEKQNKSVDHFSDQTNHYYQINTKNTHKKVKDDNHNIKCFILQRNKFEDKIKLYFHKNIVNMILKRARHGASFIAILPLPSLQSTLNGQKRGQYFHSKRYLSFKNVGHPMIESNSRIHCAKKHQHSQATNHCNPALDLLSNVGSMVRSLIHHWKAHAHVLPRA